MKESIVIPVALLLGSAMLAFENCSEVTAQLPSYFLDFHLKPLKVSVWRGHDTYFEFIPVHISQFGH